MATLFDDLEDFNDERDEGERLRDEAFDLFRCNRAALIRRLQRAFLQHILDNGPASTDALRASVEIPLGVDARLVGYVPFSLSFKLGLLRRVDSENTTRKIAHARLVGVWDKTDLDKARAWLKTNPDYAGATDKPKPTDPTDPFAI